MTNQAEFLFHTTATAAANAHLPSQRSSTDTSPPHNISFGIAGWSYPDWEGYVYSPRTKEKLRFIAGFVDMIEINSTFYRPPSARTVHAWLDQTADLPGFFFTAKLHRDITHEGKMDAGIISEFQTGLDPMIKAGKLRHLLAQFKYDFTDSPEHRAYLLKMSAHFSPLATLTLELRHASWQEQDSLAFLSSLNISVACIDYPQARDSFNLETSDIGDHAYLRLHGRNANAWFDKKAGRDETYNYCYNEKELSGIATRAEKIKKKAKTLTVVANNHYQGKEVANCLQLKALLSGKKVTVPPRLLEKYPQLQAISRH